MALLKCLRGWRSMKFFDIYFGAYIGRRFLIRDTPIIALDFLHYDRLEFVF